MIEVVEYQERWPREFAKIGSTLRRALGDMAKRIDHIGSTSVPGLASKDLIDVQVAVDSLDGDLQSAFEATGYVSFPDAVSDHRPPSSTSDDAEWEKRLFVAPPSRRRTNVHVRVLGRANFRYALLFRDYLCSHPQAAAAYGEVKRLLARYNSSDREAYVLIKDPVCDVIMSAAEEWAVRTGWQPGPSGA